MPFTDISASQITAGTFADKYTLSGELDIVGTDGSKVSLLSVGGLPQINFTEPGVTHEGFILTQTSGSGATLRSLLALSAPYPGGAPETALNLNSSTPGGVAPLVFLRSGNTRVNLYGDGTSGTLNQIQLLVVPDGVNTRIISWDGNTLLGPSSRWGIGQGGSLAAGPGAVNDASGFHALWGNGSAQPVLNVRTVAGFNGAATNAIELRDSATTVHVAMSLASTTASAIGARGSVQPGNGTIFGGSLWSGSGVPPNATGHDGDFWFRTDGGALTSIYMRRAGAWVGIV